MKNKVFVIFFIVIITGCKKDNYSNNHTIDKNTLTYNIDFPSTVYTHKKYKGKIQFYNIALDTIAEPRRDTTNFRFLIYKPFKPYIDNGKSTPIYKDSVLLENRTIDIELKFDKPGVYNIGGFARDAMRMNYYSNGIRDSAEFIEYEIIFMEKVIVKDSI